VRDALGRPDAVARLRTVAPHGLAEAARLLPELAGLVAGVPSAPPLDSPGAQARFFEGAARVLLALVHGVPPGIVAVDDAHWADAATVDLLAYLIRRLHERPLLLVVAWRGEEVPGDHRLRAVLAEALRAGAGTHLTLARLSRDDVAMLAAAGASAGALTAGVVERIHAETDGNPFFLVEYLAALTGPDAPGAGDAWAPPGGVRALLRSRLATVSAADRQVLTTAAVIGRSFDFDTLQRSAALTDEEVVTALERLLARGLIREAGGERQSYFDFSHEQLRALVYDETSQARRRLLHRRVADALAATGGPDADGPLAGRIARHYEQAGLAAEAARAFRRAGEHARGLYANVEALGHFTAALALGDPQPAGLHEAIGDLQTLLGDYGAAIGSYTAATADPSRRGVLARKLGGVHHRRGEFTRAEAQYQAAQTTITDDAELARLYADWSLTASQQGDPARAADLARRALVLAEAARDPRALAQAHNVLGLLAHGEGDLASAREHLERSLALANALDDRDARVAALNNLALVAEAGGRRDDALALAEAALALCAVQGDRHREAALHSRLADLLHEAGRLEPAMAHLKQAVRIYAEIGVEAGAVQPHIWTLRAW
jgi:predicted ATPase